METGASTCEGAHFLRLRLTQRPQLEKLPAKHSLNNNDLWYFRVLADAAGLQRVALEK